MYVYIYYAEVQFEMNNSHYWEAPPQCLPCCAASVPAILHVVCTVFCSCHHVPVCPTTHPISRRGGNLSCLWRIPLNGVVLQGHCRSLNSAACFVHSHAHSMQAEPVFFFSTEYNLFKSIIFPKGYKDLLWACSLNLRPGIAKLETLFQNVSILQQLISASNESCKTYFHFTACFVWWILFVSLCQVFLV